MMGYIRREAQVFARLSDHNSQQDVEDGRSWDDFLKKLRALADRPEYEEIDILIHEG